MLWLERVESESRITRGPGPKLRLRNGEPEAPIYTNLSQASSAEFASSASEHTKVTWERVWLVGCLMWHWKDCIRLCDVGDWWLWCWWLVVVVTDCAVVTRFTGHHGHRHTQTKGQNLLKEYVISARKISVGASFRAFFTFVLVSLKFLCR